MTRLELLRRAATELAGDSEHASEHARHCVSAGWDAAEAQQEAWVVAVCAQVLRDAYQAELRDILRRCNPPNP